MSYRNGKGHSPFLEETPHKGVPVHHRGSLGEKKMPHKVLQKERAAQSERRREGFVEGEIPKWGESGFPFVSSPEAGPCGPWCFSLGSLYHLPPHGMHIILGPEAGRCGLFSGDFWAGSPEGTKHQFVPALPLGSLALPSECKGGCLVARESRAGGGGCPALLTGFFLVFSVFPSAVDSSRRTSSQGATR